MIIGFAADYIEMPKFAGKILGYLLFVLIALFIVRCSLRVMGIPPFAVAASWIKKELDALFYVPVAKPVGSRILHISAWSVGVSFFILGFQCSALGALTILGTWGNPDKLPLLNYFELNVVGIVCSFFGLAMIAEGLRAKAKILSKQRDDEH